MLEPMLFRPTFAPYSPTASFIGTFAPSAYSHVISATKGFDSMSASQSCSLADGFMWLQEACGAHVTVRGDREETVWEGRVNTVSLSAGGYTVERGPLTDVANRVVVSYQIKWDESGEGHEEKRTAAYDDTDSQARYGVCYRCLSAGAQTTGRAQVIAQVYLSRYGWPKVPKRLGLGGEAVTVSLSCLGYYHWLNFPYRNLSKAATTASAKLTDLLTQDPNLFFSEGYSRIDTNAVATNWFEDSDRAASEIANEIVALGDASYNRMLFGVWEGRQVVYEAAPTQLAYQQRFDDKAQVVEDMTGARVPPWYVRPGKWVGFPHLFPGALRDQQPAVGTRETDRTMFIEQVTYTMPYSLEMQGSAVNNLTQALAQWGLTGLT